MQISKTRIYYSVKTLDWEKYNHPNISTNKLINQKLIKKEDK